MPSARTDNVIFGFITGEVSPRFDGRVDVAKLASGCRTLQNFKVGSFGQAKRRQGLRFVAYTKQSEPA